MRDYCSRIQSGDKQSELKRYQKKLAKIEEWYQQQHQRYQHLLQSEMYKNMSDEILGWNDSEVLSIDDYSDNFGAKLSLFCIADFLSKLILSCYSYGPERSMGMNFDNNEYSKSWFAGKRDAVAITEVLQFVLQVHGEGERINLGILQEDRKGRNELTHGGELAVCMSAIRCYNILRDMLIFMDSNCISKLPKFEYPNATACDMLAFFDHTNNLDFDNGTTILITGSLHDIQQDQKALLANMPWDIVIDFDGVSQFGGLRSAVAHERLRAQLLTPEVAQNLLLTKGITTWLSSGEFVIPTYNDRSEVPPLIRQKQPFFKQQHFKYYSYVAGMLRDILAKVSESLNPVTIIYLYSNDRVACDMIGICEDLLNSTSYSFTGVYYLPDEIIKSIERLAYRTYQYSGEDYSSRFKFFSSDLESFFSGLMSYQEQFSYRDREKSNTLLPSNDGLKEISVNEASNLNDYFEVLYNTCGNESPELVQDLLEQFFRGGMAPWCAFSSREIAELIRPADFDKYINRVRSQLGRIPDAKKDKVFYLEHTPGIGGSTLLRQIGWTLHEDYPVLLIKRYKKGTVNKLITNLYDQLLKGVVVLADETFEHIDDLEQDIKNIPRACVLVASVRQRMSTRVTAQKIPITRITDAGEEQLKKLFKKHSPLSSEEKAKKDAGFSAFIKQDQSSMRCPFMIGLYYMERDFDGVSGYVDQITHTVSDVTELKAMAFICLCDLYGQVSLPAALVNKYLVISPRSNYLDTHPYVAGAFIKTTHKDTTVYQSKHYLISQHLLDKCCMKLYNGGYQEHLAEIALDFIDFILRACNEKFAEIYQVILEKVFTSRISDSLDGQSDFARIIEEIQIPEARKQILFKLAKGSADLAERSNPYEIPSLFMMTAHFYGHLSRLCSKRGAGIENYYDAVTHSDKAVAYMEQCGRNDPLVYHMHGDVRLNALKRKWEEYRNQPDLSPAAADYSNIEDEIESINTIFDKAAIAGSPDYALTSQMDMLISYLRFVFQEKKILNSSDLNRLSESQVKYRMDVEELLCQIDEVPLGEITRSIFLRLENEYRSDIMMRDYGKAIEYYQNRLDELKKSPRLVTDIMVARQGLINARLGKYRASSNNVSNYYSEIVDKDIEEILKLLEATMEQRFDANCYQDRQRRISAYSRWLQLSKFSHRTVEQGIQVALKWKLLEELGQRNDPQPYYYLYILYYLNVLDGSKANWDKAKSYQRLSYQKALDKGYSMNAIRDLLVEGTGMNRLLDIRHVSNIAEELSKGKLRPQVMGGFFKDIKAKKGLVEIRQPICWMDAIAKFRIGENNSLDTAQVTHKVEFCGGFSYEQITAVNSFVKDTDAGEKFSLLPRQAEDSQPKQLQVNSNREKTSRFQVDDRKLVETPSGDRVLFIPDELRHNDNGLAQYLNGVVNDTRGGLSFRDLSQYEASELEKYGGIKNIMELLLDRGKPLYVTIISKNEKNLLTLSLFSTGQKLSDILTNPASTSVARQPLPQSTSIRSDQFEEPSKKVNTVGTLSSSEQDAFTLPSLKGKTVQFTAQKETANGLQGTFIVDEMTLNGMIQSLPPKEKKRLIHSTFKAKIISCVASNAIILKRI